MVDRAGHLEDDPGVAPLLPPRARLARSPTVALVAAAMLLRRRGVEAIYGDVKFGGRGMDFGAVVVLGQNMTPRKGTDRCFRTFADSWQASSH